MPDTDGPDVSWIEDHMTPIREDRPRGVRLPPEPKRARRLHRCCVPGAGTLGETWDCPGCGRVWTLRTPPLSNLTPIWFRAGLWLTRKHRRRVERSAR